ncbi:MAG: ATP-binding protein [Methanoculleus sp.]|nr:ATP-binding protein [Methanoculleus sp.]
MERAGGGAVNDCRNGSVQVMLFADRLEVWNPGTLPPSLTLEKLRQAHGSVPANPLLAEPMYLAGCIERMGTGTRDMIRRCTEAGLPEPEFAVSDGFQTIIRRPPAPGQGPQPESSGSWRTNRNPKRSCPASSGRKRSRIS